MDYTLDLEHMVSALKKADTRPIIPEFIETEGERYIFENVVLKYISKKPVHVGDIDFDAFDEDDIVSLIDDKSEFIEEKLGALHRIVDVFSKMPAKATRERKFF